MSRCSKGRSVEGFDQPIFIEYRVATRGIEQVFVLPAVVPWKGPIGSLDDQPYTADANGRCSARVTIAINPHSLDEPPKRPSGHATEFGGRGGNLAQTIGQGLLDAAYKRMAGNTLLLGKPDAMFAAVYEQIADYLSATVLPFRAVSLLNNIRTHAPFVLDAATSIAFTPNDLRSDSRWNDVLLDDPHELPAVFVEHFTSPKVPVGSTVPTS